MRVRVSGAVPAVRLHLKLSDAPEIREIGALAAACKRREFGEGSGTAAADVRRNFFLQYRIGGSHVKIKALGMGHLWQCVTILTGALLLAGCPGHHNNGPSGPFLSQIQVTPTNPNVA